MTPDAEPAAAAPGPPAKPDYPLTLADQGWFYVGGRYRDVAGDQVMDGQMYVSYKIPVEVRAPYPIVMIHGGGQTGTSFDATPDGREGWADFFVARGYPVYVVDQPARGRSGSPGEGETVERFTVGRVEAMFTAPVSPPGHTEWPGGGRAGDPVFDQLFASQVPSLRGPAVPELNRAAGAALLDRIGPAVLLTHSQSGEFGWLIADARPDLVKAIIAIEPAGPPLDRVEDAAAAGARPDRAAARPWGLTSAPITYEPPVTDPAELRFAKVEPSAATGLAACWLQEEPARKLPTLERIPVLVVTGEASYHAAYDYAIVGYLRQAGVDATWLRLADAGIHGNGHLMMLELNNLAIAAALAGWLGERFGEGPGVPLSHS